MKETYLVLEQWGRLSIAPIIMYNVALLDLNIVPESWSMISLLIWMVLPTFRLVFQTYGNRKEKQK